MEQSRRKRGFERAGRLPAGAMGLPRARARELLLDRAWRAAAGEAVARNARLVGLRRGVLTVEAAEPRWAAAIEPMLPELGGRLVDAAPALGIRKLRLAGPDGETLVAVGLEQRVAPPPDPESSPAATPAGRPRSTDLGERLRAVERGYLARGGGSDRVAGREE